MNEVENHGYYLPFNPEEIQCIHTHILDSRTRFSISSAMIACSLEVHGLQTHALPGEHSSQGRHLLYAQGSADVTRSTSSSRWSTSAAKRSSCVVSIDAVGEGLGPSVKYLGISCSGRGIAVHKHTEEREREKGGKKRPKVEKLVSRSFSYLYFFSFASKFNQNLYTFWQYEYISKQWYASLLHSL